MTAPLVSVIIRTWNRRWLVDRAIASVVGQELSDWEAIVVDDGSTDDTASAVRAAWRHEPRVRVLDGAAHAGAAAAANRGLAAAAGRFVAFLDSDDDWTPKFLPAMVGLLRRDGHVVAVADHVQVWDAVAVERWLPGDIDPDPLRALLVDNAVPCLSAIVMQAGAVRACGGFDESLTIAHDRDLLIRLAQVDRRPFGHVGHPLARRHLHAGNLINDGARWHAESRVVLERGFAHASASHLGAERPGALVVQERRVEGYLDQRRRFAARPAIAVSAVIATRDRLARLQAAIASVERQAYAATDIVVVDDGSTDGTWEWLREVERPGLRVLRTEGDAGAGRARNIGNRAADGEIIAALDDDDEWLPDYLGSVATAFAAARPPLFTHADHFWRPAPTGPLARVAHPPSAAYPDHVVQFLAGGTLALTATVFAVARSAFDRVSGYDEGLRGAEDFDLCLRLLTSAGTAGTPAHLVNPPVHLARPLACRLAAPLGGDMEVVAQRAIASHRRALEAFLASPGGDPYRALAANLWAKLERGLQRQFRSRHGIGQTPSGPQSATVLTEVKAAGPAID